jgi:ribosome-associated protein
MLAPIVVDATISIPPEALEVTAVRSSGPGGQNVNKVSSKVELRVHLEKIPRLPADALARLRVLAGSRLDQTGVLRVTSEITRDRLRNLEDAREKVRELVARALVRPKPRRATKPTRGSVERRIAAKKAKSEIKRGRRGDDD